MESRGWEETVRSVRYVIPSYLKLDGRIFCSGPVHLHHAGIVPQSNEGSEGPRKSRANLAPKVMEKDAFVHADQLRKGQ